MLQVPKSGGKYFDLQMSLKTLIYDINLPRGDYRCEKMCTERTQRCLGMVSWNK